MNVAVGEQAILRLIRSKAATCQIELAKALGLPANTVHGMVRRLAADGFILEERRERGPRGRPSQHFRIKTTGKVLAIECLGTEWKGAIVDEREGGDLKFVSFHSPTIASAQSAKPYFLKIRDLALQKSGLKVGDLDGAVVALNSVKVGYGTVLTSSVIPWIHELSEAFFSRLLGCETMVCEEQGTAELELRSWTREGIRSLVRYNVADGVSAHYAALVGPSAHVETLPGEVGHVAYEPEGDLCGCGNRGCLETLISGPHLLRRVTREIASGVRTRLSRASDQSPADFFAELYELDTNGRDAYAHAVAEEFLERCAWGLSVAVNLFSPELVVIEGYCLAERQAWLDRLREALSKRMFASRSPLRMEFSRQRPADLLQEFAAEFSMRKRGILS